MPSFDQLAEFAANHILLVAIFVALLVAWIAHEVGRLTRKYRALTPAGLTQLINRENALVVDVGSITEYQAGHIAGAKHVAMNQFDPENKDLAKVRELPVAVYCRSGQNSAQAAERLAKAGFTRVHWLEGGLGAWTAADLPVAKGKN